MEKKCKRFGEKMNFKLDQIVKFKNKKYRIKMIEWNRKENIPETYHITDEKRTIKISKKELEKYNRRKT